MSFSQLPSSSGGAPPGGSSHLSPYLPLPGDLVLARWVEDNVFYRARLLKVVDSVYSLLDFLDYGTGLSRSDDLYEDLAYLPRGCLIDQYLQRESAYVLRMKKRLESAQKLGTTS